MAVKLPTCGSAPSWLICGVFLIVAVLSIAVLYKFILRPLFAREGFEGTQGESAPKGTLVYLYMKNCTWCERFSPQWDAFTKKYQGALDAAGLKATKMEGTDPDAKKFAVSGYPFVAFVAPDETVTQFEGERTPAGLLAFVASHAPGFSA